MTTKAGVIGQQIGLLDGKLHPTAGGNHVRNQLLAIMQGDPETIDDEDLLAAFWLHDYAGFDERRIRALLEDSPIKLLKAIYQAQRKVDIRRQRQKLRHLVPYSQAEEERRQRKARSGGWE